MAMELPEAVTLAGQMNQALSGKTIGALHLGDNYASLRRQGFTNLDEVTLAGLCVEHVRAHGKWVFVRLAPGDLWLLVAIETGGHILYHPSADDAPPKFSIRLDFSDGTCLTVRIAGWGFARALPEAQIERERYPGKLPLSPIDPEFTPDAFEAALGHGSERLKPFLAAQIHIAGLGNGYLQDVFYRARLYPQRRIGDLTPAERSALYDALTSTAAEAVRLAGRDSEVDLYGCPGGYHPRMGRHMLDQPCPRCGTPIEKLQASAGSASYLCPQCQK